MHLLYIHFHLFEDEKIMLFIYLTILTEFLILIISIVLFIKKSTEKKPDKLFAVAFLSLGMYDFFTAYYRYAVTVHSKLLLGYYFPFDVFWAQLIGPFVFFYVKVSYGYKFSWKEIKNYVHILPLIPIVAYNVYFATLPVDVRISISSGNFTKLDLCNYLINFVFYIQFLYYLIYCYIFVDIKNKQNENTIDLKWIKPLAWIVFALLTITIPFSIWKRSDYFNTGIVILFSAIIVLYFLVKSIIINGLFMQSENKTHQQQKGNVLKIDDEIKDSCLQTLLVEMEKNKVYLKDDCSLENISTMFNIPRHRISYVLNNELNKSFNDFINEYRIQHACLLISNDQENQITIEAVGFDCGFKSRASFYRAFKKHTGLTPIEYRKTTV